MGDIKDISEEDIDMLNEDVKSHFKTPYTLKEFKSVGLDDTYVLHLSSNSDCFLAGLSNNSIVAFDNPDLNRKEKFNFEVSISNQFDDFLKEFKGMVASYLYKI